MVPAISLCLLCIHICCSFTMASDNFTEFQLQQMKLDVLRLSCRVADSPPNSIPVRMAIFEDTPSNTLVTVGVNQCPKVEDSAQAKQIYLPPCVEPAEIMTLEILLFNYNPAENKQFGCNYTQILEGDKVSHSETIAKVNGNTSQEACNGTNSTNTHAIDCQAKEYIIIGLSIACCISVPLLIVTNFPRCRRLCSQESVEQSNSKNSSGNDVVCTDNDSRYTIWDNRTQLPQNGKSQSEETAFDYPYTRVNKTCGQHTQQLTTPPAYSEW